MLEMKIGLHLHQVQQNEVVISDSNCLTDRRLQKQLTIITSDEESEETGSTSLDNAVRKGFSSSACFICPSLIQFKLNTID